VLDEVDHWDPKTREVVLKRLEPPGPLRFFTEDEARVLRPFCDLVTGQDSEPRIPILEPVDEKLADGKLDGFRYHDMPDDRITWRRVAEGLDATARRRTEGKRFHEADEQTQKEIIDQLSKGKLDGEVWDELPPAKAWSVVMRAILSAFYSHPWAWNEIGFGGPAYPRGYARFGVGQREHWEAPPLAPLDRDPKREQLD
jgi:hypothetical protein